ncbi:MAG: serine/threonine-protein kinase [Planctomycetaceae bacterium]
MLSRLPDTDLDPLLVRHLDHCPACWAMVGDLAAVPIGSAGSFPSADSATDSAAARGHQSSSSESLPDPLSPGSRLGHLRLLSPLGRGGMGSVYLAIDDRNGCRVAVKSLNPAHRSAEYLSGLSREARLLSQLQHPNIVQLLEFDLEHDSPHLVLELASAGSLRKAVQHRTLNQHQCVQLISAVARAVHAAHESGVLHLDLKPENILLMQPPAADALASTSSDQTEGHLPWIPKVADFGLCARLHGEGLFADIWRRPRGTLAWMAPEQISGPAAELGRATDVYALGVILYELLTGVLPFRAGHDLELSGQICRRAPCPPRRLSPGISRVLNRICLRCLQKEPGRRFQTAAELADELDCLTPRARLRRWLRRPFRTLLRPQFTTVIILQVLFAVAGFVPGAVLNGRLPSLTFSAASPAEVVKLAGDADASSVLQLSTELREADRVVELFLLLPNAQERSGKDLRLARFLWSAVIRPSKRLLSNPEYVRILKDVDPETLLLARLHEVAALAEDGQQQPAERSWKIAYESARQLHKRQGLNERLRWRGLMAVRLLDRTLTRHHYSATGLQFLNDAWELFGPGNPGPSEQTPQFRVVCEDFQKYLMKRRNPDGQNLTSAAGG